MSALQAAAPATRARPSGKLRADVVAVTALGPAEREAMWRVFSRYYAEVSRPTFEADLDEKDDVILLSDSGDRSLQGFSTLKLFEETVSGRRCLAIFSGDTIVDEAYWGQRALHRRFIRYVVMHKLRRPHLEVHWFLITKGYKTYLLLARNFPSYWPRHSARTPPHEAVLLDRLARRKFGEAWKPERGVLEFAQAMGRLKEGVAPIDRALMQDPDVRYFAQRNPGHQRGDELCCLGRVDLELWAAFTWRLVRRTFARTGDRARRLWSLAAAALGG